MGVSVAAASTESYDAGMGRVWLCKRHRLLSRDVAWWERQGRGLVSVLRVSVCELGAWLSDRPTGGVNGMPVLCAREQWVQ